jgi:hypothetical protein
VKINLTVEEADRLAQERRVGMCKVYEAILTMGTAQRVIVRHTLGELAIRLDYVTKEKQQ